MKILFIYLGYRRRFILSENKEGRTKHTEVGFIITND